MVRNTASTMQNLQGSMSDMDISSDQPPQRQTAEQRHASEQSHSEDMQALQYLNSRPSVQMCGNDERTKALMNRVATGQATPEEQAAFNEQVKAWQTQNNRSSTITSASPVLQKDYQMQLMLLEQQNKKRLIEARREQDSMMSHVGARPDMGTRQSQYDDASAVAYMQSYESPQLPFGIARDEDYKTQLMQLEEQNKKRLAMGRAAQANMTCAPGWGHPGQSTMAGSPPPQAVQFPPNSEPEQPSLNSPSLARMHREGRNNNQVPVPSPSAAEAEHKSSTRSDKEYQDQQMLMLSRMRTGNGQLNEHPLKRSSYPEAIVKRHQAALRTNEKKGVEMGIADPNPLFRLPYDELTVVDIEKIEQIWEQHEADVLRFPRATRSAASVYSKPFCDFLTENPTVFHAVDSTKQQLKKSGWTELAERDSWDIQPSGRYFVERNGSSLIAFVVGANYEPGNGAAILAGHVDALTAKLKPISEVPNKAGYLQLGVAPYAGGLNNTWWDRDLGISGRVLVKEGDKIVSKLVKLDWPIARIPTLAPHFGAAAAGPFNQETEMVPIIGLEGADSSANEYQTNDAFSQPSTLGGGDGPVGNFVNTQPKALVKAIGDAIGLTASTYGTIVNWELELYDVQPATVGGLNKEFIYAGRIDDKLCSWAAMQALTGSAPYDTRFSSLIKVVGWFDNEEIGSQLRQGAKSNFLPQTIERAVGSLSKHHPGSDLMGRTYANSFLVSSDVTHAVNPNFLGAYLENHAPHLNVGLAVAADSNGHMTTDAVSTAILQRCADKIGAKLQVFQIRNDSRSGGTVGPMLSSMTGIRAIDAGIPQLSMHSIRATTGSLDPGLGVIMFTGFLNGFEHVDKEFRS